MFFLSGYEKKASNEQHLFITVGSTYLDVNFDSFVEA